jgi:hypothetical protein
MVPITVSISYLMVGSFSSPSCLNFAMHLYIHKTKGKEEKTQYCSFFQLQARIFFPVLWFVGLKICGLRNFEVST